MLQGTNVHHKGTEMEATRLLELSERALKPSMYFGSSHCSLILIPNAEDLMARLMEVSQKRGETHKDVGLRYLFIAAVSELCWTFFAGVLPASWHSACTSSSEQRSASTDASCVRLGLVHVFAAVS